MRELNLNELNSVAGAGSEMYDPCDCTCPTPEPTKAKNNNGYGNGPEAGPPPGHSGDHNPQLTGFLNGGLNEGPRGPR